MATETTITKTIFSSPAAKKRQRLEREIYGLQFELDAAKRARDAAQEGMDRVTPQLNEFKAELEALGNAGLEEADAPN